MDPKFRPSPYMQCLRFRQGLKENIRTAMQAREMEFEDMPEVVLEATKIDSDLGKKQRRPRGILTSLTREDTDAEPLLAEYREEYRAGLRGDKVNAILDGRKDEDRFIKLQQQMEQLLTSIVSENKRRREDQDTVKDDAKRQRITETSNEFPFDRDIVRREPCTFCGYTNHPTQAS